MLRKTVSGIMLTLLLTTMLTLAFNIQPVEAGGTIYIRADGSIDPPTANITTVDNVTYTFTGNIYDEIVVERDNIVVDGAGYTLQGTRGIDLSGRSNVTIKNTEIKSFSHCIWLNMSSRNVISGNNITAYGIHLWESSNNIISGNNITFGEFGIRLRYHSSNNIISENNIANNSYKAIGLFSSCNNNIISGNNITFSEFGGDGIYLDSSSNYNSLVGNNIGHNRRGIEISSSSNSIISGNSITNNSDWGIDLRYSSSNNSISGNNITDNDGGIYLDLSSNNKFYHNNFINNTQQVKSYGSTNYWNDGYPSGGNYWSDYVDVDVKSGPSQDLPGSDSIGDTPYVIDEHNRDRYPLMNPYGAPQPPTYALTIMATAGGTTNPAPGTYSYTVNSSVQVTAIPEAGYLFDHWVLDDVNVGSANPYTVLMDKNHTLKAVFSPIPPPLSASISPLSASILAGQSVTFTSTVSGGYTPYSYQWYLNGAPVSGATSASWTFTPTTSGIYYVHLKVTDAKANTAQSDAARITVATVPVGGYSFPIQVTTKAEPIISYIALIATLTAIFTKLRPKTRRKR